MSKNILEVVNPLTKLTTEAEMPITIQFTDLFRGSIP